MACGGPRPTLEKTASVRSLLESHTQLPWPNPSCSSVRLRVFAPAGPLASGALCVPERFSCPPTPLPCPTPARESQLLSEAWAFGLPLSSVTTFFLCWGSRSFLRPACEEREYYDPFSSTLPPDLQPLHSSFCFYPRFHSARGRQTPKGDKDLLPRCQGCRRPSIHPSITCPSISLPTCLSIHPSVRPSTHPPIITHLSFAYLCTHQSVQPSTCPSVYPSFCIQC